MIFVKKKRPDSHLLGNDDSIVRWWIDASYAVHVTEFCLRLNSCASHLCDIKQFWSLYTKNRGVISVMGSPIDVGGGTPSSHFSPHLGLVVNFCYGVMKPVLYASRVWSWNPGCLSFVHCVDFEFLPFSRRWAAYVELAGIVPLGSSQGQDSLGSSQGQDSRESCDNLRTNWGSLEKRGRVILSLEP